MTSLFVLYGCVVGIDCFVGCRRITVVVVAVDMPVAAVVLGAVRRKLLLRPRNPTWTQLQF
jgi:hypothetical protein